MPLSTPIPFKFGSKELQASPISLQIARQVCAAIDSAEGLRPGMRIQKVCEYMVFNVDPPEALNLDAQNVHFIYSQLAKAYIGSV